MCLTAASFRSAGFSPEMPIDRDMRQRRMAQARQLGMMSADPHPLVGWARFLQWQRTRDPDLAEDVMRRLREAVHKAEQVYKHWRPELRYKVTDVGPRQLDEGRSAASWFIQNRSRL